MSTWMWGLTGQPIPKSSWLHPWCQQELPTNHNVHHFDDFLGHDPPEYATSEGHVWFCAPAARHNAQLDNSWSHIMPNQSQLVPTSWAVWLFRLFMPCCDNSSNKKQVDRHHPVCGNTPITYILVCKIRLLRTCQSNSPNTRILNNTMCFVRIEQVMCDEGQVSANHVPSTHMTEHANK